MSSVANLVNSKLADSRPGKAADSRKKFIIYMQPGIKTKLDGIAEVTRSGKIELASELFAIAVEDAANACVSAGKLNKDFTVPASAAPAPAAPKPAADKPATPADK